MLWQCVVVINVKVQEFVRYEIKEAPQTLNHPTLYSSLLGISWPERVLKTGFIPAIVSLVIISLWIMHWLAWFCIVETKMWIVHWLINCWLLIYVYSEVLVCVSRHCVWGSLLLMLPGPPQRPGLLWNSHPSERTTAGTENRQQRPHTGEIIAWKFIEVDWKRRDSPECVVQ